MLGAGAALAQAPELPTSEEYLATSPVDLAYTNDLDPKLARSSFSTPWLDRDRRRVVTPVEHTLTKTVGTALAGREAEIGEQVALTRHGLFRRVDEKFRFFVPRTVQTDGYGLWRYWESQGDCPKDLLIRDLQAENRSLRATVASLMASTGATLDDLASAQARAAARLRYRPD